MKTLIIVNPYAKSGGALRDFKQTEGLLEELPGEFFVEITERAEDVAVHLDRAKERGIDRLIAFGGDGTNNIILNELASRPELSIAYGGIPSGTGRDWARSLGIPKDPKEALKWLTSAEPTPCDIGRVEIHDAHQAGVIHLRYFLNIASAGISGEIDRLVNLDRDKKSRFTFFKKTLSTIMKFKAPKLTIYCDDENFYEGTCYLATVANGRYFGHGIKIAPNALIDDGLFDVIVLEGTSKARAMIELPSLFKGAHLAHKHTHHTRARKVTIWPHETTFQFEMDGEEMLTRRVTFNIKEKALPILLHPGDAPLVSNAAEEKI